MEAGLWLWLEEWVIRAGDIIALKVDEGLEQSRMLLLVPDSQLSTLNSQPACTAVHRDPANAGRRFIPLLLGDGASFPRSQTEFGNEDELGFDYPSNERAERPK